MLAKKIEYTDYNGEEREETFYFNLTEAEIAEMELSTQGGLQGLINTIIETKDQPKIVELFKTLILKAYGEKSNDGRYFKKRDSIRGEYADDFASTEAYSVLFMELATNADAATEFVNKVIPTKVRENVPAHPTIEQK